MKVAIDNVVLINKFLKGEASLLANRELRLEKALDEIQLLTTQGLLLAKGRFTSNLPNVMIRIRSDYWALIHQLAIDAGLLPLNLEAERAAGATFAQYDYHSVPAGYQIHCQAASAFWKTWWVNHRKMQLMDILLLCNRRWYPVKHMLCDTGTIYVKTWRGEQTLALSDTVVWLDRNTQARRPKITVRKHHTQNKLPTTEYPYHDDLRTTQLKSQQPRVPADLQQVIQTDDNRLIVHTVLGPVVIGGHNLTCTLARKITKIS
ncbi:hypothetical protein N836_15035 [Leptolyngbya sp. Heron Island J]|uniref:hypothetical protein n=1 Tax=Leptolyngbya sp. Heron Island J TaxID=1385935 RepID=UPI0003B96B2C|nr:hypothetical protein [Leptolyngbya sp. Heron Island J]ESA34731.1 hypothetical protein N836_15035 [Leptolyngbya sp. Heron Island J]